MSSRKAKTVILRQRYDTSYNHHQQWKNTNNIQDIS